MTKVNKLILCALLGTSCIQPALAWPPLFSTVATIIAKTAYSCDHALENTCVFVAKRPILVMASAVYATASTAAYAIVKSSPGAIKIIRLIASNASNPKITIPLALGELVVAAYFITKSILKLYRQQPNPFVWQAADFPLMPIDRINKSKGA